MASVFELSQQVSTIMENLNNDVPNVSDMTSFILPRGQACSARLLAFQR